MGESPRVSAEDKDCDMESTVREAETKFSTDLSLPIKVTTNDAKLPKALSENKRYKK